MKAMTITFQDNKRFHQDLHIEVPELKIDLRADTYFFALDSGILPEEETPEKVKVVLKNLLNDWSHLIEEMENGGEGFLPYDFSDQYTSGLVVRRQEGYLVIRYAGSQEYFSMYPSFMHQMQPIRNAYSRDDRSYTVPLVQFQEEIHRELDKIG